MAHPYNNKSPFNCWKGYERVPGKAPGTKGSCRKSSPANFNRPFTSPMNATKGGGTTKVCLPQKKVSSMSAEEKKKVVSAKESAGRSGKRERSQRSEVKGARKKGATLKDWFEKENWVNVKTGEECGAPTKRTSSAEKKSKFLKTAYDIGSLFLKGGTGLAATMLTPGTTYAHQDGEWVTNPDGSKQWKKFEFFDDNNDGGLLPKFKENEEKTPLNKSNEPRKTTKGKGRNFRTVEEGAGMTEKGVKEYKKKNPGSNLQTAVTEKNPKGKRAARRKSFCARSKGWTGERGRAARRRWNC